MSEAAMRDLAQRFFDAIEAGDLDGVRAIYAPNAIIWHNDDEKETSVDDNLGVLTNFVKFLPKRSYQDRRVSVFPGGFVQQHVLHLERRDGQQFTLPACLVCQVENERITRLDEYLDSAAVKKLST